jgi:DNA-binding MarR family transcriptional regulator
MGTKDTRPDRSVAELVTQLGRYAYGDTPAVGLTPAQWTALRYFSRANRFSRTVSAFAEFHATTRGTASGTVKSLVQGGYLKRTPSSSDGRSARLDMTSKARAILLNDPFQRLMSASDTLSTTARRAVSRGLDRMLGELAQDLGKPRFGVCTDCRHLCGDGFCLQGRPPYECGLLNEPLAEPDIGQLCVNFESS